jgi:hypothetical protein
LNSTTDYAEGAPHVIGLADGGFLAVWLRTDVATPTGTALQLVMRSFGANGLPTAGNCPCDNHQLVKHH